MCAYFLSFCVFMEFVKNKCQIHIFNRYLDSIYLTDIYNFTHKNFEIKKFFIQKTVFLVINHRS